MVSQFKCKVICVWINRLNYNDVSMMFEIVMWKMEFSLKTWNYVRKTKTVRVDFSRSVNSERVSIKIRRVSQFFGEKREQRARSRFVVVVPSSRREFEIKSV